MTAIICTTIICATVLVICHSVARIVIKLHSTPEQAIITEEDLEKAYRDNDNVPDFQKVIQFINEEFSGVDMEENDG